jgi:hypothetical protein
MPPVTTLEQARRRKPVREFLVVVLDLDRLSLDAPGVLPDAHRWARCTGRPQQRDAPGPAKTGRLHEDAQDHQKHVT